MSNPSKKKVAAAARLAAVISILLTVRATAQSVPLLESIRFQRGNALAQAQSELAACQRADCDRLHHLSLLVGVLTLSSGDARGAMQQLLAFSPPELMEAFHAYYLGMAQFYAYQRQAAAESFARAALGEPQWLRPRAAARQAEALLALGNARAAAPLFDQAAPALDNAELYYQRAQVRRALRHLRGEIADLKTVALRFPTHPYGPDAIARLAEIRTTDARLSAEERLSRAQSFLDAGRAEGALSELERAQRAQPGGAAFRARIAKLHAAALFSLGREAEANLELAKAFRGPPSVAAEAALLSAHRMLRTPDRSQARALMALVVRKYPKQPASEEAGFYVGWLDLQTGHLGDAVTAFAALERQHPKSRWQGDALWFHALALMMQENRGEADAVLHKLLRTFPRSDLVPQARYWLARNGQLTQAAPEELAQQYEQIVEHFPGSFYALLSIARLEELGHRPPPAFPDPPKLTEATPPRQLQLALALETTGLLSDASSELRERLRSVDSASEARQVGHVLQRFGEYGFAHDLATRLLWADAYGRKDGEALALLYPQAYRAEVEREAGNQNLDPFLVWAVMRRESTFHPGAISTANARGLMQLIPGTAQAISKALSFPAPATEELFSPEVNIRLGSWYLARLLERFRHPALSVAAYNAGPEVVARWARERRGIPLDLFVEEVPYKQTRAYIKQVIADYFTYHALHGRSAVAPKLSLEVPEPSSVGVSF